MDVSVRDRASLRGLVQAAAGELAAAGIEQAHLDARVLVCAAAGIDHAGLIGQGERAASASERAKVEGFVERRLRREPVSRIIGRREFWSLDFAVSDATLDPRADTETVVRAALEVVDAAGWRDRNLSICDLGTGTGCLLLALLHELGSAIGTGVDISTDALGVAARNAADLGLGSRAGFIRGDWTDALAGRFDLIVSNPPYIRTGEIGKLEREVRDHDPRSALDGGADGLDAYRRIIGGAGAHLCEDGWLVLEIGSDQADAVTALLSQAGFTVDGPLHGVLRDLAGRPRCVRATAR